MHDVNVAINHAMEMLIFQLRFVKQPVFFVFVTHTDISAHTITIIFHVAKLFFSTSRLYTVDAKVAAAVVGAPVYRRSYLAQTFAIAVMSAKTRGHQARRRQTRMLTVMMAQTAEVVFSYTQYKTKQ